MYLRFIDEAAEAKSVSREYACEAVHEDGAHVEGTRDGACVLPACTAKTRKYVVTLTN
jgi:hypothetical protein